MLNAIGGQRTALQGELDAANSSSVSYSEAIIGEIRNYGTYHRKLAIHEASKRAELS